jgi:uncharacterized protein DUF3631
MWGVAMSDSLRMRILRERYEGDRPVDVPETIPRIAVHLAQVVSLLRRYVVFANDHQVVAVALWTAHTHDLAAADSTPYLAVTSPEKRSGKTRLFDVLELLVANPWRAVVPSEAVVFRKVQKDGPTLLLDEADAIWGKDNEHEGLRALLNAGHRRGVRVPRMIGSGSDMKVAEFDVFCCKAIAGIGQLPDTVADRSIPIRLSRRMKTEHVERFRFKEAQALADPIRRGLERWAEEAVPMLREARPDLPDINDRAADGWEPLLAIADSAGGDWPQRARLAAVALHGDESRDETFGVRLLSDIRYVFAEAGVDRLPSADLAKQLADIEEAPWGDLKGRAVDARGLAWRLRRFEIGPKLVRFPDGKVARGYSVGDFAETWSRYLDDDPDRYAATPQVDGLFPPSEPKPDNTSGLPSDQQRNGVTDDSAQEAVTGGLDA